MPSKNTVKPYLENTFYHVYNRGVEGRNIFCDSQDYKVFLGFIKRYLTVPIQDEVQPQRDQRIRIQWKQRLYEEMQLTAYCLMPNHFHLLLKQKTKEGMTKFIRALMNSYVKYFNKKYKRIGGLFQGIFKAIPIDNDAYLIHLTRYIHLNPLEVEGMNLEKLEDYYCSYGEYIGKRETQWVIHKEVLDNFGSKLVGIERFDSYRDFIEKYRGDDGQLPGDLLLE